MFWDVLFYKNVIVLHHGEWNIIFYFNICIKFTLLQWSQRWRNDNISLDKTIKLSLREKTISEKNLGQTCYIAKPFRHSKSRIICGNKTYFWAPDIPCNHDLFTIFRSSHRRCSIKKGALENFANFTGKHLCKGLFFNKVGGLRSTFLKRKFLENIAKFLRTLFWQNTSRNCSGIFQNIHIKNNFRSSRPEVLLEIWQNSQESPCASGLQLY